MQPVIQQNQKKFGTVSFIDNKVRINYSDGTDSVLFEDISSISYKTINKPNVLISLACTFIGIIIMFFNTCCYCKNVGIKNDVFWREANFSR